MLVFPQAGRLFAQYSEEKNKQAGHVRDRDRDEHQWYVVKDLLEKFLRMQHDNQLRTASIASFTAVEINA